MCVHRTCRRFLDPRGGLCAAAPLGEAAAWRDQTAADAKAEAKAALRAARQTAKNEQRGAAAAARQEAKKKKREQVR